MIIIAFVAAAYFEPVYISVVVIIVVPVHPVTGVAKCPIDCVLAVPLLATPHLCRR